jgi:orotate phosphoribosyltransferase
MADDPGPDELVRRMLEVSELHGDFVLSSGRHSSVYFDKFRFLADPGLLGDIAARVQELIAGDVDRLAAPEGAATLLLAAVGLRTRLPMVVVRKEPKAYGTRSQVEGDVPPGSAFALIEDVSTTGAQVRAAAELIEAAGGRIGVIVVALDRGGADTLRAAGYEVRSVASLRPHEEAGTGP